MMITVKQNENRVSWIVKKDAELIELTYSFSQINLPLATNTVAYTYFGCGGRYHQLRNKIEYKIW